MEQLEPLGKYISIIHRHAMMYANRHLKPFNIGSGQLGFLLVLFDHDGLTQEDLSKCLSMDKSTTAKAVKSLEQNGYVRKKISEKDKRSYNLYITDKAISIRKTIRKMAFDGDNNILLKGFSKQEKNIIYDLLKRMAQNASSILEHSRGETDE